MTYLKERLIELTKRVYRLTLLFPKKEPLRYKIRELANEILTTIFVSEKKTPEIFKFEILDSFLEIVKDQNWVSQKEILEVQSAYQNLKNEILSSQRIKETEIKDTDKNSENFTLGELNERQKKIVEVLKEKGKIQPWQMKEFFPKVSKRTLRRDFQKLVKKNIIERVGTKNATFYILKTS